MVSLLVDGSTMVGCLLVQFCALMAVVRGLC
jgi:hypothetical protein